MSEKRVHVFEAVDEQGATHVLHVYQQMVTHQDQSGTSVTPGRMRLTTATGERVNRIDKGVYEIVTRGLRLKSDDPNAP